MKMILDISSLTTHKKAKNNREIDTMDKTNRLTARYVVLSNHVQICIQYPNNVIDIINSAFTV